MYEVELKVAAAHDAVRDRLPEHAESLGAVEQVDTYFDAPHRNFAETDEALRIRRERPLDSADATAAITYKGPLVEAESKTREEFESDVADGDAVSAALERLGFEPAATVRKERERFAVDEYTVTLDDVDGLGPHVEVETEHDGEDVAAAREGARSLLRTLGCDPDQQLRTSYLGLLLEQA